MNAHDETVLDEAAALWKANLIYFQGGGWARLGKGNYRWKDITYRYNTRETPAAARGAVKGKIIPHNAIIKRAFATVDQGELPEWKLTLGNFLGNLAENRNLDEAGALEYLHTHKSAMGKR